jgi:hypothetical protein
MVGNQQDIDAHDRLRGNVVRGSKAPGCQPASNEQALRLLVQTRAQAGILTQEDSMRTNIDIDCERAASARSAPSASLGRLPTACPRASLTLFEGIEIPIVMEQVRDGGACADRTRDQPLKRRPSCLAVRVGPMSNRVSL